MLQIIQVCCVEDWCTWIYCIFDMMHFVLFCFSLLLFSSHMCLNCTKFGVCSWPMPCLCLLFMPEDHYLTSIQPNWRKNVIGIGRVAIRCVKFWVLLETRVPTRCTVAVVKVQAVENCKEKQVSSLMMLILLKGLSHISMFALCVLWVLYFQMPLLCHVVAATDKAYVLSWNGLFYFYWQKSVSCVISHWVAALIPPHDNL